MAERKPYTTKTRQIILEYLKRQQAVTVSVADIEKYLKDEGIKVNTTTVYRCLDKLCIGIMDSVCSAVEICFMESARIVKKKKLLLNPDSLLKNRTL